MSPAEGFTEDNQRTIDAVEDELVSNLTQDAKQQVLFMFTAAK